MNLTALSYVVAAAVTLLGIIGQWQDDPWPDLWRVPAASLLIGLLLEGLTARRRGLRISPRIPERVMLGQPATAELVLGNDGERPLRVELQQVFANSLSGADSIAAYTVPAHGNVELASGQMHLMLVDIAAPLRPDTTIKMTLRFEKAGDLTIDVPVRDGRLEPEHHHH